MEPFFRKGQPLDSLIFIILIDSDIPKCNRYIRMVQYLFNRYGVMCLLIHVITKSLSQCVSSYGADTKCFSSIRKNIICLLSADCLVGKIRRFEQKFIILI